MKNEHPSRQENAIMPHDMPKQFSSMAVWNQSDELVPAFVAGRLPTFRHVRACPTKGMRVESSIMHRRVWKLGKQSQRHSTNMHRTLPFLQDFKHVVDSIQSQQRPARNQSNASSNATLTRQSTRRLLKEMKSPSSLSCRAAIPA